VQQRILIVDDEPAIRFAVSEYFTTQGYAVDSAADGEAAKALLARQVYEVAIVDVALAGSQGREGLDILRHIRAHSYATRVVLLTAWRTPEVVAAAENDGAAAVMSKTTSLAEVGELVVALMPL
jgi:DNA-binding response OmpR family regulator